MTKQIPWTAGAIALSITLAPVRPLAASPNPGASPQAAALPNNPTAAQNPTPPTLRLGDGARPTRYTAELTVVPDKETFQGVIDIELALRQPTTVLWLNADELSIQRAEVSGGRGKQTATPLPAAKDFVGFRFPTELPAGPYKLHLEYSGKLSNKESGGAVRQKEGGLWYATTHFEPLDARRVFPCFDEPSFKVPWQLTLNVPAAGQAFANTPVLHESDSSNGMKRVEFAPTKPLPSYLIAWAVGPFDVVPAGKSARSGTPVRIITAKGQQAQASWAAQCSAQVLAELENYFGSNYPYEKLDVITVPMLGGAMENPGLVTFDQTLLLNAAERDTIERKRAYAAVAAHEFAHQWFGDLVTTAWWDDIWLNEAFATWMTPKILERWQPTWGAPAQRAQTRNGAMSNDSLVTARQIRQPIQSNNDIKNAFDGITYGKGASVIAMFERFLGPEVFQKGVQRYFRQHAHGNATAREFLADISAEAGKDIAPAFSTFLEQPGVPLIQMDLQCAEGKPASLKLAQQRYLPEGSSGAAQAAAQLWKLPVCVRWKAGTQAGGACTLLQERQGELQLPGLNRCPDWVSPNEQAAGYYRTLLGGKLLQQLLADGGQQLTVEERIGAVSDVAALARAGRIPYAEALALVPKLAADKNRYVVDAAISLVAGLRDTRLVPSEQLPAYARFIREVFGPQARKLGWAPRPGEDEDTRLLRNALLPLVADQGEDPQLGAQAKKLAAAWLKSRKAVDPELVDAVLSLAARDGDRALFEALHKQASQEPDRHLRQQLLFALGRFSDRELTRAAMELTLSGEFEPREAMPLVWGATRRPATQPIAYEFVKTNFDKLVDKLPRDAGSMLPFVGVALCDDDSRRDMESFFKDRSVRFTGGPRMLAQALERMQLCIAFRKAQTASIGGFFSTTRPAKPGRAAIKAETPAPVAGRSASD